MVKIQRDEKLFNLAYNMMLYSFIIRQGGLRLVNGPEKGFENINSENFTLFTENTHPVVSYILSSECPFKYLDGDTDSDESQMEEHKFNDVIDMFGITDDVEKDILKMGLAGIIQGKSPENLNLGQILKKAGIRHRLRSDYKRDKQLKEVNKLYGFTEVLLRGPMGDACHSLAEPFLHDMVDPTLADTLYNYERIC